MGQVSYLRDAATGEFWSPTFQPCGTALEHYQVRHGLGYSVIEGQHADIASQITYFAPLDAPCEIWLLRLTNHSNTPRHLQISSYFEWLLGAAPDWHREFHRTFIETEYAEGALLASKVLWELPVESKTHWNSSWDYVAFHSASLTPTGYDGDKRDFLGRHGHLAHPQALVSGQSHGKVGRWSDAIGSLQVIITMQPSDSEEIAFTLGAAESKPEALRICARFRELSEVHTALVAAQTYWRDLTGALVVETPDPTVNVLANGWLASQAICGRLFARTAYYQMGGAYGFRDQLQDSLTWLQLGHPEKTLEQIQLHARHQYQEGIVLHWWHPLAETGLRSDYSDDLLWLPFVTIHYLLCAWAELPVCDPETAKRFRQEADSLREAVNRYAWDGAWYWRATTDTGNLIGSHQSPEGKIFLNAQTWAVLGGTADEGRAHQAMTSAREQLYTDYGALLLAPAYTMPDPNIGYLTRYAPGTRENGGVYTHAACWASNPWGRSCVSTMAKFLPACALRFSRYLFCRTLCHARQRRWPVSR